MKEKAENVVDFFNPNLKIALESWSAILPKEQLILGEQLKKYDNCPSQSSRRIRAALQPISVKEIQALVKIAVGNRVPLFPISRGKNWGFGGANPVQDNCVIVDLSLMNQITSFDPELGIITVEPGVTQGQIAEFLRDNHYPFMLSAIVAGPNCSYLANALERGFWDDAA